jgi:putative inorganic carbon (hco3(-)) transporter
MVRPLHVEDRWPLLLAPIVPVALLAAAAAGAPPSLVLVGGALSVMVIGGLLLTAFLDVAWLFSIAIALTIFSGSWRSIGFPTAVSPDRLMLIVAFVVFLLRDPSIGRRPYVRLTGTHAVLAIAAAYAICAALAAGTIGEVATVAQLLDRFGIIPFLLFLVGPVAFAEEHQRRILLGTMLVVGAYLGVMALFQGLGLDALVFPRYIVTLNTKVQEGRARGPFGDAAINGVALYYCAVMAALAFATMPRRWVRNLALAVAALCVFDLLFTEERSVWVGALVASLVAAAFAPRLRRYLLPAAAAIAVAVLAAFALVPGLGGQTGERIGDEHTEWDRLNLNRAAENMIVARPLFGFGPHTFQSESGPYFQQNANFPLTNTSGELHNVILSNTAELGLVGVTLWLAALALAVGGAIVVRGPPELFPWRVALIAVAVIWLIVANLVPMRQPFPNQFVWLLAGVVWPWRYSLLSRGAGPAPAAAAAQSA